MKSRVLGLACAAGLAAGCQSSAAKALSRYQATKENTNEVAQVSHEASAGLPGASKRRAEATSQSPEVAFEAGEKALQQFYRDKQDKPAHLQRARISFEAAAKADPTFAAAQHRLAIVADLQERYRESESYYQTALSLDPGNANIAADLGWSYMLQERWSDADRALQRALQIDPGSAVAKEHLAQCRQRQTSSPAAPGGNQMGQMLANRPAQVGPGPAAGAPRRDDRQSPQNNPWGPSPVEADHMGEYLREQLSQVDRYTPSPAGQPLTLGPQQRQAASYGQPQQQQPTAPLAQAPASTQQFGQSPAMPGQSPAQWHNQGEPHSPQPSSPPNGQYFTHLEPRSNTPQRWPADQRIQTPPPYPNVAGGSQLPRGAGLDWPAQQTGRDGIQRTQALEVPVQPDQAIYQAPQLPPLPASSSQPGSAPLANGYQQGPAQGGPYEGPPAAFAQSREPQKPAGEPQQASSLEKARRDAALMGLGVGPGQYLSSLEQTPDRMSAGSQSHLNGAAFAATPVRSPDLTPPPDLRQSPSFFEQSPMTPPTNSMGQAMPGGTSSMMTPGTINDPNARFQQSFGNPPTAQSQPIPSSPSNVWNQSGMQNGLQGYDDSRRAADQQLQQTLQSTWAGTPSGAIPSPSGGVPMQSPAPQSQMMNDSWGRQPVAPAPYAQAPQPQQQQMSRGFETAPLPIVNPSSSTRIPADRYPPAGRVAPPVYREGVVMPDQYGRP